MFAVRDDLEKAYESMWKFGIMRDLHNAGLHGRLPLFIESFLKNRRFHVRLGSSYSDLFDQEMGVSATGDFRASKFAFSSSDIRSVSRATTLQPKITSFISNFPYFALRLINVCNKSRKPPCSTNLND